VALIRVAEVVYLMPVARSSVLLAALHLNSPRLKMPPKLSLRFPEHPEPDEEPDWLQSYRSC